MAPLTDDQLAAIECLRGRFMEGDITFCDSVLRCFLTHRGWHVDDAAVLLQEHLKWRIQNLPVLQNEVMEVLEAGRVTTIGTDLEGRPVFMLNLRKLSHVDFRKDGELRRHLRATIYCAEDMIANMPRGVDQWVAIINCAGITMPPTKYLQEFSKVFLKNYPERVYKVVMYPVPKMLVHFVKSLMWFLPKPTQEKFKFVDTVDGLCGETGISHEGLPKELFGVPVVNISDVPEGTTVLHVGAGKKNAHSHKLVVGSCAEWEVYSMEHTVNFRLCFLATDGDGVVEEIVSPTRLDGINGVYTAKHDGVLEFSIDNSFSMMTGKRVLVTVRNIDADPSANADKYIVHSTEEVAREGV